MVNNHPAKERAAGWIGWIANKKFGYFYKVIVSLKGKDSPVTEIAKTVRAKSKSDAIRKIRKIIQVKAIYPAGTWADEVNSSPYLAQW